MAYSGVESGAVSLLANPLKLSETLVTSRYVPPVQNERHNAMLIDWLGHANRSTDA